MVVGVDIVMLLIVRHKSNGTELATMSLRNRKVSQQEHGRSKVRQESQDVIRSSTLWGSGPVR